MSRSNSQAIDLTFRYGLPSRQAVRHTAASDQDEFLRVREAFLWRTRLGEFLSLDEMNTKHLFHAMKMCFNSLTPQSALMPILFTKRYRYIFDGRHEESRLAWHVLFFIYELDRRGDLPSQFFVAYKLIRDQVIRLAGGTMPALPSIPDNLIGGSE